MNETTTSNQWDNWNFPLYIPENRLKRTVKDLLGKFALAKSPSLRKAILNGLQPKTLLERAAVMSLLFELEQKGEMESIAKIHRSFWASEEAFGYYQFTNERMNGMYELTKPDLLAAFQELLDEGSFKRVIEIGCGEGHVLEELSKELNSIDQFVGIDINKSQITATMNRFASNPKLSFLAGDALEYLDQNEVSNSILFTFGGVMEYFTERELKDFFTKLKL
jgi:SAM-dependent methyltransferase